MINSMIQPVYVTSSPAPLDTHLIHCTLFDDGNSRVRQPYFGGPSRFAWQRATS